MNVKSASIIDLGLGNVGSLQTALKYCGIDSELIEYPTKTESELVVLPGVGSYPAAMEIINKRNLRDFIREIAVSKLFIGICLGMQLLGKSSTEGGEYTEGLGLIDYDVVSLKKIGWGSKKVPNIGFHKTLLLDNDIFAGFGESYPFYYIHSYGADPATLKPENKCATFEVDGREFISAVRERNIIGFQFHPEKSHRMALQVFSNIVK